ncbi:MAG TPA: hypothetical protein VMA83_12330 [Solirubrobacteraceae bacterium]|nr:hypothetical protein [Solirubrobacteraceae bacterium]
MLSARDREIVAWISGLGAASALDVAVRFGVDERSVYRRMRTLVGERLLSVHRVLHRQPGLYAATPEGLRWCGFGGAAVQRLGPANFVHQGAVSRVAAALGRGGLELLGEREFRLRERREERLLGSVPLGSGAALHRPDLLALAGRRRVALEVELTVKSPRRLERICTAYARARHLDGVIYLAAPGAARALRRAVAGSRAGARVRVVALHETAAVHAALRAER